MERVESVRDSKEDELSSAGDSEEDESSSVGTKTDGELIEELLPGVNGVIVEYFKLQEILLMLMSVHFTMWSKYSPMCVAASEILNVWSVDTECVRQSVDLDAIACLKWIISFIPTDEVEERVDSVGNLEDDSSSGGDSEEEETGLRVEQKVRR